MANFIIMSHIKTLVDLVRHRPTGVTASGRLTTDMSSEITQEIHNQGH